MRYSATRRVPLLIALFATAISIAQSQPPERSNPPTQPSQSAVQSAPPSDDEYKHLAPGESTPSGVYKVGNGVSAPRAIYAPDPEYAEEARVAGLQGTCVLRLIVDADGKQHDVRVIKALSGGLDEKAIEAVNQWKFEPGQKDGQPVATIVNVEVTFHLYNGPRKSPETPGDIFFRMAQRAFKGDKDAAPDQKKGYEYLSIAANLGSPKAQFEMGEYTVFHGDASGDNITAYMWYELALRNGYKDSKKKLKELARKMSSENIAEAETKANNWKPSAERAEKTQ